MTVETDRRARREPVVFKLNESIERLQYESFDAGRKYAEREANMTIATFKANVDNPKLSDAEFRQFMRNCLQ